MSPPCPPAQRPALQASAGQPHSARARRTTGGDKGRRIRIKPVVSTPHRNAGYVHRQKRAPMQAVLQRQEISPSGMQPCRQERPFIRLRSAVAEECPTHCPGQNIRKPFGKLNHWLGQINRRRMLQPPQLFDRSLRNRLIAVTAGHNRYPGEKSTYLRPS